MHLHCFKIIRGTFLSALIILIDKGKNERLKEIDFCIITVLAMLKSMLQIASILSEFYITALLPD